MAEIKNTFLKGKMNQDLDSRLLPNGEYREAINLMISRSEGSTVGEFENVLGNTVIREIDGNESVVIGHFIDETNNIAYFLWTDFDSASGARATNSNNCGITQISLNAPYTPVILVEGFFLNFNKSFPVTGINIVEELLFWTDNNNQPRKINIQLAQNTGHYTNEDQISVAKYAPCESVIVLDRYNARITNTVSNSAVINIDINTSNVKIGDIVSQFETVVVPTQIVEKRVVIAINSSNQVTLNKAISNASSGLKIVFERPTMTNKSQELNSNGATASIASIGGSGLAASYVFSVGFDQVLPEIGMIVTGPNSTVADNITITSVVANYSPGPTGNPYPLGYNSITLKFSKDVLAAPYSWVVGNAITIGVNQFFDGNLLGVVDDAFLEDKFVRFSYRFKFEDNEYSLMAPFSQPMFIPKQDSSFGKGENYVEKDMDNAYKSTILTWFENSINNILVKVPMPEVNSKLMQTKLLVTDVDILYKESDALAVKVLDTVTLSDLTGTFDTIAWSDPVHGVSSTSYLSYDYTSNKPYKTLPQGQTTRVYDKVPIKALAQELIGNRVVYGNYVDKHTPPTSIAYNASIQDKKYYFHDTVQYPYHNLKQNRTYQVGFVLSDRYGRQSDVILSSYDSVENLAGSTIYSPYRSSSLASTEPVIDWFGDALNITIDEAITSVASTTTGEPGIYDAALRPLGWYSYKVVVKQQEQEYYNVYLPGFVNGAPIRSAEDADTVAYMSLLSDNINKVPRDLKEVGPTDLEYSSAEVLYIRVNNPNMINVNGSISKVPWNQQYYPNLKKQNILSIASVRDMEIAAIPFVANAPEGDYGQTGTFIDTTVTPNVTTPVSIGSIPWGQCGPDASLYNSDLNPFVCKISTSQNGISNPVGAEVSATSYTNPGAPQAGKILSMVPFLSVAETKPMYSLLEIFWETSLQGKIQTLNSLIDAQDDNVIGTTVTSASFAESLGNANEITPFNFITGSSGNINTQLTSAVILQVVDQTGADRTSENLFTLTYTGANGIYKLNTNAYFTFLASSGGSPSTDIYTFTFRTVYNPSTGAETRDTSTLTATLTNVVPTITSFSNPTNITTASDTIDQFYGFNGTNANNTTANKEAQLIWDLDPAHANYFANSLLFSMSSTGLLSVIGTIVEGTTYNVGIRLRDSDGLTGFNQDVDVISFTVGVQHTPKSICEGRKGSVVAACGQSYATYFLASATTPTFSFPITIGGILFPQPTHNYNVRSNATGSGTYTTGALTQGTMKITPNITSTGGSSGGSVEAYYAIQYRSSASSPWSSAVDTSNNSVGAIKISASTGVPGTSNKTFSILGEYRVITTAVTGEGCSDGSTIQLYVDFADATYPGNCTGPL